MTPELIEYLVREKRYGDALEMAEKAINNDPNQPHILFQLGYLNLRAKRYGIAHVMFKRAQQLGLNTPNLLHNLGVSSVNLVTRCSKDSYLTEGEEMIVKATKRGTPKEKGDAVLALIEVFRCNPEKALQLCLSARQDIDNFETMAYAEFMLDRWEEGWKHYESILNASVRNMRPVGDESYYEGEKGIDLFVMGEQGIGDEVSYASFIPQALRDNRITLECDPRLAGLFKRSFPEAEVHGTRRTERPWAQNRHWRASCLSGSLGQYYRKTNDDFPGTAFLVADPDRRLQWKALFNTLPGRKVGLAWTGGVGTNFRGRRSLNLEALLPLLKTPGITWVSLQYSDPTEEIKEFEAKHGIKIHHYDRAVNRNCDYDETAALISELECVISVCTSTVHLCGGLGKRCLVLAPKHPRWWYGLKGKAHTWYASLEIYRQKTEWPIAEVIEALQVKEQVFHRMLECV